MTNNDIAQKWVQGLSVIKHHIEIADDIDLWQKDPQRVLKAVNRINDLKKWCLTLMEAIPEMEQYFIKGIEERNESSQSNPPGSSHSFFFLEENKPSNNDKVQR